MGKELTPEEVLDGFFREENVQAASYSAPELAVATIQRLRDAGFRIIDWNTPHPTNTPWP